MVLPVAEETWPPQSVREALLSSPSGRKRYADCQAVTNISSVGRLPGTPSLLDRLRLARNDRDRGMSKEDKDDNDDDDDDDDDEETLQLKLAAIEAKLKLKKLQSKAKKQNDDRASRPASVASDASRTRGLASPRVDVRLSPVKRPAAAVEPKSPSRVLLGIDKGRRGADVSLRRAKMVGDGSSNDKTTAPTSAVRSSLSKSAHSRRGGETAASSSVVVRSFSERMAAVRDKERTEAEKREKVLRARTTRFKVDATEVERLKAAAEEEESHSRGRPQSSAQQGSATGSATDPASDHSTSSRQVKPSIVDVGDASMFEGFSGLHLSARILPHSFLKRTLPTDQFTIYRVPDLLKNVTSPAYEIPDGVADFVVFGIVASSSRSLNQKSQAEERTKRSSEWTQKWDDGLQNTQKFMALTLTDLRWTVDLYLFGTALPRYYRLSPGTVIAILNPTIMPPKKGKEDTGAFSLALHDGDDTVLEIGTSKDLGYCNVIKKDGKACRQWVDGTKTAICEWHLNAQIAKTQAKRMGVNAGANGFGGFGSQNRSGGRQENNRKGTGAARPGRGFDWESGSHYFISSSSSAVSAAPKYNPHVSTAKMLDADDNSFIAEGQFQRDKAALLQNRMAKQEKEREIARKLAQLGSGTGAGADYMRRKAGDGTALKRSDTRTDRPARQSATSPSPSVDGPPAETAVSSLKAQVGRKRAAEDVRLSPAKKKTRFLTDRGIKEAGRESIRSHPEGSRPMNNSTNDDDDNDDDDDDLDII